MDEAEAKRRDELAMQLDHCAKLLDADCEMVWKVNSAFLFANSSALVAYVDYGNDQNISIVVKAQNPFNILER
jgi:hypothetical protein